MKAKKNFISVLIANYNGEKYINRCLDSLCRQKFKRFEVIFFDDRSTDKSIEFAKKFKNKLNIKIIKNYKKKKIIQHTIKLIPILLHLNFQKVK